MKKNLKIYFITLGCKVNSRESDGLCALFLQNGYGLAEQPEQADIIYVNSCTVTADGAAKSRAAVRKARRNAPNSVIVMGGCLPQTQPLQYDADIVVGNTERSAVFELLEEYFKNPTATIAVAPHHSGERFEPLPAEGDGHTRAFLKVQDGCPRSCSYCIVSKARGNPRSANEAELIVGATKLVQQGHSEIVLCGINLSYYGCDTGTNLASLCIQLEKIEGLQRIRLGSLEPDMLTDQLCKYLAECKKLAPHFHLSLQSGSNNILKAMNRFYSREEYIEIVERLRRYFNNPSFTTDIMVGFPGEGEQDFEDSCTIIEEVGFIKVHIFRYSKRPGTVAAELSNQITEVEKKQRAALLTQRAKAVNKTITDKLLKLPDSFIAEKQLADGSWVGTTGRYIRCSSCDKGIKKGDLVPISEGL